MSDLDITKIPGVMRSNNWQKGARLMDKWFSDPANTVPANGITSTDIITMDWVLGFSRARQVYDTLIAERIWLNDAARKEIVKLLARKNALGNGQQRFRLPRMLQAMENEAIQFRVIGGNMDMLIGPMDDLRAALGNFTFRVVVGGFVEAEMTEKKVASGPALKVPNGNYSVTIEEVGIYIKDSYDFNDPTGKDQDLGNWNFESNSVGRTGMNGGTSVHNSDFRKWRTANGKGGDFFIYSDLRILRQSENNTFIFKR
ncbi:DUF6402 family protein [Acidovorax sp. GBBC 3334]|uniref:DUF6402 family protein n=1 Tax=Acidovorax sp. GBBC 3334 TaxID=2940496 RepID=UPI0023040625|nr:DUF6402 family protein [Acidovorax sp. GBBC 3334]MDA8457156.1 DUF6402 family protein [Acidovorax sp. GBBC 3334]